MGAKWIEFLAIFIIMSEVKSMLNSSRMAEILQSYKGRKLNLAPRNRGESLKVHLAANINNMVPLNFINEHIYLEMDVSVSWCDKRLKFDSPSKDDVLTLQNDAANFFWRPDIIIDGEKGVKHETFPEIQSAFWVYPDGNVLYSTKLSVTLYCHMTYKMFPFDKQTCSLRFESWSYNVGQLTLGFMKTNQSSAILISDSFRVAKFILDKFESKKLSIDYGISGVFDQLRVIFYFKRDIRFYIMEYYFPIICMVLLSFISFWINFKATPARVALPVTTFLTLTKMLEHVRATSGIYGAADALETFLNLSVVFVFAVMIEYGIVELTGKRWSKRHQKAKKAVLHNGNGKSEEHNTGIFAYFKTFENALARKHQKKENEVHLLDQICRYLFPMSYIGFLAIYATVCGLNLS